MTQTAEPEDETRDLAKQRKAWSTDDDAFLIAYGHAVGYGWIARHDLGRTENAGYKRIAWLRKNRPDFVAKIEKESGL